MDNITVAILLTKDNHTIYVRKDEHCVDNLKALLAKEDNNLTAESVRFAQQYIDKHEVKTETTEESKGE